MGCRGGGIIGSGSLENDEEMRRWGDGEMGELVMMFLTLRSFYCTKTDTGYRQAQRSPQRVHSLVWGSSPLIFSIKSHHPSRVAFYKWLCTQQQVLHVLGPAAFHLMVGLGLNQQASL